MRTLVLTDGGGPDALQRGSLTTLAERHGAGVTAVVTGATKARLVVTALSWFFSNIKSFGPDDIERALVFLNLEEDEHAKVIEAALSLVEGGSALDWERRLLATRDARR